MASIFLTREMALGNGTRPRGFLLGSCRGDLAELCGAVTTGELREEDMDGIRPAEGVELVEVLTALRNPQLVTDDETEDPVAGWQRGSGQPPPVKEDDKPTWRDLPVERLAVPDTTHGFLREAGIKTLGELDSYAEKHRGLTDIKGIGRSTEEQIAAAMKAVFGKD